MTELFSVWTPEAALSALVAGLGVGYLVIGPILRNPLYASGAATPFEYARLVAGSAALVGTVFYVGQVLATLAKGDLLWARVLSRFSLWLLYAACLGLGAWLATRRDNETRAARARARALKEKHP